MRNKNIYTYDGHRNPDVWVQKEYPFDLTFEEKLQLFIKESKEKNRIVELKEHTKSDTKEKKAENARRRKISV